MTGCNNGRNPDPAKTSLVGQKEKSVLPNEVAHWPVTALREKLVKIGAKVVRHGRYVTLQLAEVTVSRDLFQKILSLIDDLRLREPTVGRSKEARYRASR